MTVDLGEERTIDVLLVEDSPTDAESARRALRQVTHSAFAVEHVKCLNDTVRRLNEKSFDVVLLDINLPDSEGIHTVKQIGSRARDVTIVVMTGLDDETLGVEAITCCS